MPINVDDCITVAKDAVRCDDDQRFGIAGVNPGIDINRAPYFALHGSKRKAVVGVMAENEPSVGRAQNAMAIEHDNVTMLLGH
jgi:hypothetical protein